MHVFADERREQNRKYADRREHHAGHRSRVAHVLLQPQRHQHDIAEEGAIGQRHRQRADPEVPPAKQTQIDHWMILGELPDDKDRESDDGDDGEQGDLAGSEPVEILALVEHDLQCADPKDQQSESDAVYRQSMGGRLATAVDHPRYTCGDEPDRYVDVEDPRP